MLSNSYLILLFIIVSQFVIRFCPTLRFEASKICWTSVCSFHLDYETYYKELYKQIHWEEEPNWQSPQLKSRYKHQARVAHRYVYGPDTGSNSGGRQKTKKKLNFEIYQGIKATNWHPTYEYQKAKPIKIFFEWETQQIVICIFKEWTKEKTILHN